MTITEALAEIALLKKKIPKKIEAAMIYVVRDERERDPLEKSGGSAQHLVEEMQAITDLNLRLIVLRRAIAKANDDQLVTCGDMVFTLSEWLVWKREVLPFERARLRALAQQIAIGRSEAKKRGPGSRSKRRPRRQHHRQHRRERVDRKRPEAGRHRGQARRATELINATKMIEE